jgi:pimeloyl-ACP methyl ester carboxylesterase
MKNFLAALRLLSLLSLFLVVQALAPSCHAQTSSHDATIDGVKLHYTLGGHGDAVILLHGYAETSLMWTPILPALGEKFTVLAPDLPGIGDSGIPSSGSDFLTAAKRIHELAKSLGIQKARVVGHDIGLMTAYAYAAQFPSDTVKLVLMDAFLPGVPGWEAVYNNPAIWHFRFNGETPEKLVLGRERTYFEHYWNDFAADKNHSIPEAQRQVYTAAYARPGRMRSGWAYFISFPQLPKTLPNYRRPNWRCLSSQWAEKKPTA